MDKVYFLIKNAHLAGHSRSKLSIPQNKHKITYLHPNLETLLNQMLAAFTQEMNIKPVHPLYHDEGYLDINYVKKSLIDFDRDFNQIIDSKFENDVIAMESLSSFQLKVRNDIIQIHILFDHDQTSNGYIASVLHALNTFCYLFPYHYHGLKLYICLDNNQRNIDVNGQFDSYHSKLQLFRQTSTALNVSGVTNRNKKTIILTKKEEIIKLLFHELVHYVQLDGLLRDFKYFSFPFSIDKDYLNLSEAYTEMMAVILNSGYQAIHLWGRYPSHLNLSQIYQEILNLELNYSIYLSASILTFFGYEADTYQDFFYGYNERKSSPILIWEYVIVRTQLFLNLNQMSELVDDWRVVRDNLDKIVNLMQIDDKLVKVIGTIMKNKPQPRNISYTLIDLDWSFF